MIDRFLNRLTMYKIVSFGLMLLLAVAELFALTDVISISASGLFLSVFVLGAVCYASNELLARLYRLPSNTESFMISALILACVLPPITSWQRAGWVALTAVIAMASKYVLVYRGSHIFNPVAIGAFVVSVTGVLPATWWIGSPPLAPFTLLLGLVVLRKTRRFTMFLSFAAAALLTMLLVGSVQHGQPPDTVLKNAILSWPLIFFGTIMLTEPATAPKLRFYQVLYAIIVGCLFSSQLHAGGLSTTPQAVLLLGNLFALLTTPTRGVLLTLKRTTQLSPTIYELTFVAPVKQNMRFIAGQYLEWTLPHRRPDIRGNRRSFSIVSSPNETEVRIAIKHFERSSSFKTALLALQPGQTIRAAHPAGSFTLPADPALPLLFIAGGVGITPYISMLGALFAAGQRRDITLLYLASDKQDQVYKDVLKSAEKIGLKTRYVTGRLSDEDLHKLATKPNQRYYISGPDGMVRYYKHELRRRGVPVRHLKSDYFTGY